MSYRALAAFPLVTVAVAMALVAAIPEASAPAVMHGLVELVKVSAMVGMAAGALAFAPGDYMRRGWGLGAVCYALLLIRDAWLFVSPPPQSIVVEATRAGLILLANASVVVGTLMLARAWSVAGLELPVSSWTRRVVVGAAVLVSLLFAGPSLGMDVMVTLRNGGHAWTVLSDLGDLFALPLLAPVALVALAVREGSLRWPWGLLTASLAAWLFYDGVLTLPTLFHWNPHPFHVVAEAFRIFAGTSACAAGLAQRRAMRDLDGRASWIPMQ